MDVRLTQIFAAISSEELASVASAVLGDDARPRDHRFTEISKPHADPRTIGVVQVSGTALVRGQERPWSCVTKIIDLSVTNKLNTPVDPRTEISIYEKGYFAVRRGKLRPARCHHISRPNEYLTILWLEDLTGARAPPFSLEELSQMARHLGEWNGEISLDVPELDLKVGGDFQVVSWNGFNFEARARDLLQMEDNAMVRAMYASQTLSIAAEYVSAYGQLIQRSKSLPHSLALADCPVSNFFYLPGETVVIDWAGLGSEPVGADGGRFIGSALTWGKSFAAIIPHEHELFEQYLSGLRDGGETESREVLRLGYLSELAFYLATIVTLPTMVAGPRAALSTEFFEKRFEMPITELGAAAGPVIERLPEYIVEIERLLS